MGGSQTIKQEEQTGRNGKRLTHVQALEAEIGCARSRSFGNIVSVWVELGISHDDRDSEVPRKVGEVCIHQTLPITLTQ
jgi:hypothetical protein